MPGHLPVRLYAVVDVAVQCQERQGNEGMGNIDLVEIDSVLMLSQPSEYEEPSHPYRNPQAVAQIVRIGPKHLPVS